MYKTTNEKEEDEIVIHVGRYRAYRDLQKTKNKLMK